MKYLSPDGHQEGIYNEKGKEVTDSENLGTYNYGTNGWDHFWQDMMPYYRWGNTPSDKGCDPDEDDNKKENGNKK